MRRHITDELTFLKKNIQKESKGRLFSGILRAGVFFFLNFIKGVDRTMKKKESMCSLANNVSGAGVKMVEISKLHDFKDHPFKVERNLELFELRQSIEKEGVLVPLLVRSSPYESGYEIISGHRRKEAAIWVGLENIPVIIRELDDNQSIVAMVDSNLQREKILPSEKAFAYKMRLQAMNRQGRLSDTTSDQLEPKLSDDTVKVTELGANVGQYGKLEVFEKENSSGYRSNEHLARMVGESVSQIKRYIRLTNLIPKILDMVDREQLAITSAVQISFLTEEEQYELYAVMDLEQTIPNLSQANKLKRMSQQRTLDMEMIYEVMSEIKPNQREQVKIPLDRIKKYFPDGYTPVQQIALIEQLLKNWARQSQKK